MPNNTKLKEEFYKKFVGLPPMYHTESHQNIQGYYSDKMMNIKELWNWIDNALTEARKEEQERIIKEIENYPWLMVIKGDVFSLSSMDRDTKVRKQMRKEVLELLTKKK
jgi:hypothetical protein